MNAFETLGIQPRLVITDEAVRDAFRAGGKIAHPDAGGEKTSFASLHEAFEIVSSPSSRLRHWLELRGIHAETRGTVDPAIMDLFTHIGETSQRAEGLARRRDQTFSALGRAMLERETQSCREEVERAIMSVEAAISRQCASFPDYEALAMPDPAVLSITARNLAFLEKWRGSLRGLFSRLV